MESNIEYLPRNKWVLHRMPDGVIAISDHVRNGYLGWRFLEESDSDLLEKFLASENLKRVIVNRDDRSAVTNLKPSPSD